MNNALESPHHLAQQISLETLATNVGQELAHLAALSGQMQAALSLCHFAEHTNASAIRGLQGIDRITQTLEDLGRLMLALAAAVPPHQQLASTPLLAQLRLQDLKNRLGRTKTEDICALYDNSGDVAWL